MAKDSTFYFSHDYNARNDIKIIKLIAKKGYEGYGIYWALIEDLYNNDNLLEYDIDILSFTYRSSEEIIKSVIEDFNLFIVEDRFIKSLSVQKRLDARNEKSNKGKENALKRWGVKESTKKANDTIFYVLRVYNEDEEFIKCGITRESISRRYSGKLNGYNYDILYQHDNDFTKSIDLEVFAEKEFKRYMPKNKFAGYLECYDICEKDKIINFAMLSECKPNAIKENKEKDNKENESKEDDDEKSPPSSSPKIKLDGDLFKDLNEDFAEYVQSCINSRAPIFLKKEIANKKNTYFQLVKNIQTFRATIGYLREKDETLEDCEKRVDKALVDWLKEQTAGKIEHSWDGIPDIAQHALNYIRKQEKLTKNERTKSHFGASTSKHTGAIETKSNDYSNSGW